MLSSIKKQLFNGFNIDENPFLVRRLLLTLSLLFIALIAFFIFIFINISLQKYILASFDLLISLFTGYSIYSLIVKKNINFAANCSTFLFFTFLIVFSYINKNENFGLVWTLCFPLFVIPIQGVKKGFNIILLYYVVLFPLAYSGIGEWNNGFWSSTAFLRFVIASFIFSYVSFFYESTSTTTLKAILNIKEKEKIYLKKLESLSITDQLTGLYNRRYFDEQLKVEKDKIIRYKTKMCLIMIDIDHFKEVNDQFGHQAGDNVLVEFSQLLHTQLRNSDILARWGGEEFMILLPEIELSNAKIIAEKLKKLISEHAFSHKKPLTASFGVTEIQPISSSKIIALKNVDTALYKAKSEGRNRVCLFEN